ncbi:hypothetical protein LUZ61_006160 [Rhynchospora tenuis]|uniref:NTF2 domain-containing protein n=1 Tax=Rhynchospora tenuis TaxID=198213 RepID=A0AAD5ZR07_9POAL|nr:hypothetical protein LUZ61_006160 [Rhynchospora tenuis]
MLFQGSTMAATSLSSEDVDQVGKFFVTQYYNILYKHPEVMYNFYKDASTITLVDGNTVKRATGRMEIHLLISAVKISLIEVTTANFLRSYENGLMVVVSGLVQTGDCEKRRKFIQAFFLAPQDNGYYILNDLVHFVDEEGIYIPDALAQGSYENLMMTQAVSGQKMLTEEIWVELNEFDRLSGLTDELLLHIMCFLTTRQAVNTCILSKRWRNLWRYLSCLHFDAYDGDNIPFITSFFNLRNNCHIDTFRLHWITRDDCWEPLFTRVLESHPRVLSIKSGEFSSWHKMDFDSVFTCASVEEMELDGIFVPRKSPITLFNLKKLNLTSMSLDGESVNNLISGCPVLEDLVMKECCFMFSNVTIVSHSLKKLFISIDHYGYYDHYEYKRYMADIHLNVPSLVSLHVINVLLGKIWLKNMSSLVKAHIEFWHYVCDNYLDSHNELLSGLSTATYIELIGPMILKSELGLCRESPVKDLLLKELPNCSVFANLRNLYLGNCNMGDFFSPISQLVHLSTYLEAIKFVHEEEMAFSGTDATIAFATANVIFLVGSIPVTIPFTKVIEAVKSGPLNHCKKRLH